MTTRQTNRSALASERGMALISALLLLMVMSGLAIALTASGRIEVAMGDNEELYARTRSASEAGLNHGAAVVLGLTSSPTYPLNNILLGPDGLKNTTTMSATVNADNGLMTHLITGGAACAVNGALTCWTVAGTEYSYTIRLFDDDDPALKNGVNFTNVELTAMAGNPPGGPAEDGNRYNDLNKRIVIRSTGYGPRNTMVQLEQMLMPIKMPALLVNGNLEMAGNAQVIGSQGSVHANGNLLITGNAVTINENATASGTLTSGSGWHAGEMESGGMPAIPVPDIRAIDYFADADFVLQANGSITNKAGTTTYCSGATCRTTTPPAPPGPTPPGLGPFGWSFSAGVWDLNPQGSGNNTNWATYYAKTDVRVTGNPGTAGSPIHLTIIAEGNIQISGNPDLQPEPSSELQFVTDKDLWIHGTLGVPLAFEGRILVREQIDFAGNPTLAGQVIVQDVPTVSTLVTNNKVTGSVTLSYNGLIETVAYTVSGWRETQ